LITVQCKQFRLSDGVKIDISIKKVSLLDNAKMRNKEYSLDLNGNFLIMDKQSLT